MSKTAIKRLISFFLAMVLLITPIEGINANIAFGMDLLAEQAVQTEEPAAQIEEPAVQTEEQTDPAEEQAFAQEAEPAQEAETVEKGEERSESEPIAEPLEKEQTAFALKTNGRYTKATPNYKDNTIEFVVKADGYAYCYAVGEFNGWNKAVGDARFKLTWVQEIPNDDSSWVMKGTVPIDNPLLSAGSYEYKFVLIRNEGEENDSNKWQWINADGWEGDNSVLQWNPPMAPTDPTEKITMEVKTSGLTVSAGRPVELLSVKRDAYDQMTAVEAEWKMQQPIEGVSIENNRLMVTDQVAEGTKIHVYAAASGEKSEEKVITVSHTQETGTLTHYFRKQADYQGWNFWNFPENGEGQQVDFLPDPTDLGAAAYLPQSNVIVRKRVNENDWAEQTQSYKIPAGEQNAYIVDGDDRVYTSLKEAVLACNDKITAAIMDSKDQITAYLTDAPKEGVEFRLLIDGVVQENVTSSVSDKKVVFNTAGVSFDPTQLLEVQGVNQFTLPKQVLLRNVLNGYVYTGNDMGAVYTTGQMIHCKLWAPTACRVEVALYQTADQAKEKPAAVKEMTYDPATGVYSADLTWDEAYGQYYLYRLTFAERSTSGEIGTRVSYAVDPYAQAVGLNGTKGFFLDIEKDPSTFPQAFTEDERPEMLNPEDAIIYEMHVRDFTIDPNWGGNPAYAGKYLGIVQPGTTYTDGKTTVSTGLDHLKELGITHVHLLPTYDIASVNETISTERNWGYDPLNYNAPEGSYATDPADPANRIREYRQMVMGLHEAGIRVVIDQVYNHMASVENMNNIVPGYYFRSFADGKLSNGSGCGNEMASERPMVRKFIVDSNCHWVKNYRIDGLRFDLMALLDKTTMRAIKEETQKLEPSILIYGEPWKADTSPLPDSEQTTKNQGISAFNDTFRDALRGNNTPSQGFVNGSQANQTDAVQQGLKGQPNTVSDPELTINYVEAHDNYAIWDQIVKNEGKDAEGYRPADILGAEKLENWKIKKAVLANSFVLTAQGVPFFQGGSEILRTKNGDHNSYKSDDETNDIDWAEKIEFEEVFAYYKGLIRLRKEHPAFRMNSNQEVAEHQEVYCLMNDDNLILQHLKGNANGDKWQNILVIYNASIQEKTITWLPQASGGVWKVVADAKGVYLDSPEADLKEIVQTSAPSGNVNFTIPSSSIMVLYDAQGKLPDLQWDYLFADQSVDYMEPMEPAADDEVKVRFRAAAGEVTDAVVHYYDAKNSAAGDQQIVMHKITDPMFYQARGYDSGKIEFWEGTLPAGAGTRYYNFEVRNKKAAPEKTAWISGGKGENGRGVSSKAPRMNPADANSGIDYGFAVVPAYQTPSWAKEAVFYQIMVDRFRDGDERNNRVVLDESQMGNPSEITEWGEPVTNGKETDQIWNNQFYGGDLIGVQEAIPYLKNVLGVDAVYLMPIFQSGSDHKYDTDDYNYVDKNFGGNPALADLSADLHDEGMHLMLDGVFNHTSTQTEWFKDKSLWNHYYFVGDYLDNGNPPAQIGFYPWHGYTNLAKLNYKNQAVQDAIYQGEDSVAKNYLREPYNIDGWRLDAAEDVNDEPRDHDNAKDPNKDKTTQTNAEQQAANLKIWTEFRTAVDSVKPDAYILGEYWGNQNQWFNGNAWDGKMNYGGFMMPFIENCSTNSWLGDQSLDNKGGFSVAGIGSYTRDYFKNLPYQAVLNSTNSISTHDKPRFLNREYAGKNNEGMMELAVALQMTYPGIPMIYYGDEIGMIGDKGGADPYNRATFSWDTADWNEEMLKDHRTLIAARKANKDAFVYGAFEEIVSDKNKQYIAYARYGNNDPALVVLNNHGQIGTQEIVLDRLERYGLAEGDVLVNVMNGAAVTVHNGSVTVPVKNMSAAVYVKEKNAPKLENPESLGLRECHDQRRMLQEVQNVTYMQDAGNITVKWDRYEDTGVKDLSVRIYDAQNKMVAEKKVSADVTEAVLPLPAGVSDYMVAVKANADRTLKNEQVNDVYADSLYVQAVTAGHQEDQTEIVWQGYSVSAKDHAALNFYVELPEKVKNDGNAYMLFTMEDGSKTKVMVSDAAGTARTVNGKTCYLFSCGIAPKQMTDRVRAQMFITGENGQMIGSAAVDCSVQEYAKTILEDTQAVYTDQAKNLLVAMLNYGAALQKQFDYKADQPANAILTVEQQEQADAVAAADFAPYASAVTGQVNGIRYRGSSLLVESRTAIRHYFAVDDAAAAEQYTFTVCAGGKQMGAVQPVILSKPQNGANAYIEIPNINAKDLDVCYDVAVKPHDGNETMQIHYSALSYGKSVLEGAYPEVLQSLAKQLYWYNWAALEYAAEVETIK